MKKYVILSLFGMLVSLSGCQIPSSLSEMSSFFTSKEQNETEITNPEDRVVTTLHIDNSSTCVENQQEQNAQELYEEQGEMEETEAYMRSIGAQKVKMSQEVIETEESLEDTEINNLSQKGKLSEFGIQTIIDSDGNMKDFIGYKLTKYELEDGTALIPSGNTEFTTESGEKYSIISIYANADTSAIWVMEEEKWSSFSESK